MTSPAFGEDALGVTLDWIACKSSAIYSGVDEGASELAVKNRSLIWQNYTNENFF